MTPHGRLRHLATDTGQSIGHGEKFLPGVDLVCSSDMNPGFLNWRDGKRRERLKEQNSIFGVVKLFGLFS